MKSGNEPIFWYDLSMENLVNNYLKNTHPTNEYILSNSGIGYFYITFIIIDITNIFVYNNKRKDR